MIRDFNEYILEGIVEHRSPDLSRSSSLRKEAEQSEEVFLQIVGSIGVTDVNANTLIKIAYDAIMSRIRAEMLKKGYSAAGRGAHEAEVAYLRKLGFSESDVRFCDQLRYFRNGIMYYGKNFNAQYAKKVHDFVQKTNKKLRAK